MVACVAFAGAMAAVTALQARTRGRAVRRELAMQAAAATIIAAAARARPCRHALAVAGKAAERRCLVTS